MKYKRICHTQHECNGHKFERGREYLTSETKHFTMTVYLKGKSVERVPATYFAGAVAA